MDVGYTQYVYLTVGEHLSCILFRAIMGKAVVNITVQVFGHRFSFLLEKILRSGIAGSYGNGMFDFIKKLPSCFTKVILFYIFTSNV